MAHRDLYMLALAEFQALDETDELSYFGITGIDACPLRPPPLPKPVNRQLTVDEEFTDSLTVRGTVSAM